jgi:hypothetical protein
MAGEIRASFGLAVTKGSMTVTKANFTNTADLAGARYSSSVQDIGNAAHEAVVTAADLSGPGWAMFRNLDATNSLSIGLDVAASFVPFITLLPGEAALCRLATLSLYAKAAAGTPKLETTAIEA